MNLVEVKAEEFGLDVEKAKEIELGFSPSITALNELKPEYDLIVQKAISPELCLQAGELRKKFVKVRTSTDKIHKSLKAFYLAGGRFVDAWKNKQLAISEQVENKLKEIEEHYIRIEQAKKEERAKERIAKLQAIENTGEGIDLLNMPDDMFATVLKGLEAQFKERKEADAKAEAERIKLEQEKIAEEKRIREENARLRAEAEAKEKALAEERAKAEAERKKLEDEIRKQKEEQAKKEAEERAKAEALAKAGDKEKIIAYFSVLGGKILVNDSELNRKYEHILKLIAEITN